MIEYKGIWLARNSEAYQKVYSIINKKLDAYLTEDSTEKVEKAARKTAEKVEKAVEAAKEKVKEVLNTDKKE